MRRDEWIIMLLSVALLFGALIYAYRALAQGTHQIGLVCAEGVCQIAEKDIDFIIRYIDMLEQKVRACGVRINS